MEFPSRNTEKKTNAKLYKIKKGVTGRQGRKQRTCAARGRELELKQQKLSYILLDVYLKKDMHCSLSKLNIKLKYIFFYIKTISEAAAL